MVYNAIHLHLMLFCIFCKYYNEIYSRNTLYVFAVENTFLSCNDRCDILYNFHKGSNFYSFDKNNSVNGFSNNHHKLCTKVIMEEFKNRLFLLVIVFVLKGFCILCNAYIKIYYLNVIL